MTRISLKVLVPLMALTICSCASSPSQEDAATSQPDSVLYARGFQIRHFDEYTAVSLRDPWDTLKVRQTYILVEKDRPLPENLPEGIVVRTPVERAIVYTSVHCAVLEQLACSGKIIGVCESEYISSPEILSGVASGSIADIGLSTAPDVEKIIDLGAEMIIASPFQNSGYGAAEKLGIPILEAADYMENHPLGRTEWCRLFGLFFGKRAEADSIFHSTMNSYLELKRLSCEAAEKPSVLLELKYGSAWLVPSGESYIGTFHRDAGGDYIFKDITGSDNAVIPFEKVFDIASDADFWLFKYASRSNITYKDLEKEYQPYSNFRAFKEKKIYVCNTMHTSYYDDLTIHPDRILEDFIFIYHPELLPGYSPKYYFPLQQ